MKKYLIFALTLLGIVVSAPGIAAEKGIGEVAGRNGSFNLSHRHYHRYYYDYDYYPYYYYDSDYYYYPKYYKYHHYHHHHHHH